MSLNAFFYTAFSTQFFAELFVKVMKFPDANDCRDDNKRPTFEEMWENCRTYWRSKRAKQDKKLESTNDGSTNHPDGDFPASKDPMAEHASHYKYFKVSERELLKNKPPQEDHDGREVWLQQMHEVKQGLSTVPAIVVEKENEKAVVDVDEISSGSGESVRSDGDYYFEDERPLPNEQSSARSSSFSASRAGLTSEQKRRRNDMLYRIGAWKRGF